MAFKILDGFVMTLETEFGFVLGGGGGVGALRGPIDSNRSFPVLSTLRIVLAAFEIFRRMLDLPCLGLG